MTGPTRVSQTIGELMGELMKATSNPDRITAAAQVLATLELADAVRSTVPRATFVNTVNGTVADPASAQLRWWEEGEPDPTEGLRGACCENIHVDLRGQWACTWPPGHLGRHVAGDGTEVCAAWA